MTPILQVLWIIYATTMMICGSIIYKIILDCEQRAKRRKRQQEIYNARSNNNGGNPSC